MAPVSASAQPQTKSAARGARLLQRACACADTARGYCPTCHGKKPLQRKAAGGASAEGAGTFIASPLLTQGGVQLPVGLRRSFAPLYGSDFADVRVHHDAASDTAARRVSARAFTLGQHIHFAAGEYRPHDRDGQRLLAHELSHTLQQRGMSEGGDDTAVDAPGSALEREADAAAEAAMAGRPARVSGAGARGVQAKLLQRQPQPGSTIPSPQEAARQYQQRQPAASGTGIGTAAGGSEKTTVDRKIDENTVVHITRTFGWLCQKHPTTKMTPLDKIFYLDEKANALGMKFTICHGMLEVGLGSSVDYGDLINAATGVLSSAQNNPAMASDLPALLDQIKIATATATAKASVVVGPVRGEGGFATTVPSGGKGTTIQGKLTYQLGPLKAGLCYSYDPVTREQQITACAEAGEAPKEDPDCYSCDCKPAEPNYSCTKEVSPHQRPVKDQPAQDLTLRLFYNYNSAVPVNPEEQFKPIVEKVGQGFKVEHIYGYASPEGSRDPPKPPIPGFAGNKALSQSRADDAHKRLAEKVPAAALPQAEGKGELLGDLKGTGDTPDKELTPDLVELLTPLNDDERLETLGVDDAVRKNSAQRANALADIQAFVEGRDARGLALGRRPRWEKIFPFLRRVDVSLHHEAVTHEETVPGGTTTGDCTPEDRAYADAKMPKLPSPRQLPSKECKVPSKESKG